MAQEANGLVYNGSNPTGVGAVYFDKTVDPVQLQLEQLNSLDKAIQNKEARNLAKKKLAIDMAGDGIVDTKNIYDSDVPYFMKRGEELTNMHADLLRAAQDPDNPKFIESKIAFDREKQKLMTELEASRRHKEYAMQAAKEYDPTKHDNRSLVNQKAWHEADLATRMGLDPSMLNVPKKSTVFSEAQSLLKTLPKSQQAVRDANGKLVTEKLPFGGIAYQVGKAVPDAELNQVIEDIFTTPNHPFTASAADAFAQLPESNQKTFIELAQKTGSDPIKEYMRSIAHDANIMETSLKNATEGSAYKQTIKGRDDMQKAMLFAEQIGNLKNGNPAVFQKSIQPSLDNPNGTPADVARSMVRNIKTLGNYTKTIGKGYSTAFQNQVVGKFTVYDTKGMPQLKDATVEMFKYDDNEGLKIKTNQTSDALAQQGAGAYVGAAQIDDEGFIPFTDEMALTMAKSLGIPLDKLREALVQGKGYTDKVMDFGPLGNKGTKEVKTTKTYIIGGKKYKTIDEIKQLSPAYTDEVIQKAIKEGKIKVE